MTWNRSIFFAFLIGLVLIAGACAQSSRNQGRARSISTDLDSEPSSANSRSSGGGGVSEGKCTRERDDETDMCMQKLLIFGDRSFTPPRNVRQINQYCRKLQSNSNCIRSYSRDCLKPFPRQIFGTILSGMGNTIRKTCRSSSEKRNFLHHLKCATPQVLDKAHKCMDTAIIKAEFISKRVKQDDHIPAACCVYHQVVDCVLKVIRTDCPKIEGVNANATTQFYRQLMGSIFGDVLDLVCGRFDNLGSCDQNLPELMKQFKSWEQEEKKRHLKPEAKSVLMPMLEVFTKFDY